MKQISAISYVFSPKGGGFTQAWGNALGVLHAKY